MTDTSCHPRLACPPRFTPGFIIICTICCLMLFGCESNDQSNGVEQSESAGAIQPPILYSFMESNGVEQSESAGAGGPSKAPSRPLRPAGEDFFKWAHNGNLKKIQDEIDNGVDVNSTNANGQSALMWAAFNGHIQIVELLIDKGAKVNHQDLLGRTPLMCAASGDNLPTVQLLLARQAKVNVTDSGEKWTALMLAAAEGQTAVVKTLLENGADWKMLDIDGESAKDFAANNRHSETVKVLDDFARAKGSDK